MRQRVLCTVSVASLLLVIACDKKSDTSDTPAASATTTSVLQNIAYQKKIPGKGTHPVTQKAVRGGIGDNRPSINSAKTGEPSTDRQMRKPANVDKVDCKTLPDNAAECDGKDFYFCDDKALWVVDCDAEGKFGGVAGGACFEGEKFIDCLGCDTADDGTNACCDFNMTVCCDKDGNCYSPKS